MSLQLRAIAGFIDETAGTAITAMPTTLSVPRKETYRWELDTSAGDIDVSAIAITGALDGQTFEFLKDSADANGILFTDGAGHSYDFNLPGEILSLRFDGTTYVIGA